jgi:hypothetical protein
VFSKWLNVVQPLSQTLELRRRGGSLMYIRDVMRERGHAISHETVRKILARRAREEGAAA